MSKEERVVLQETKRFVEKIITEVYGQRATRASVQTTARRIMEALPANAAEVEALPS